MDRQPGKTGVVMLNLGGPDSLDAVEPFLYNLFSDRDIIRGFFGLPLPRFIARRIAKKRTPFVRENYRLIGGRSPLLDWTRRQAEALGRELGLPIYVAMRYWAPRANETVQELVRDGIEQVIALPCYPHRSGATTGSSLHDLRQALKKNPVQLVSTIESYADHPGYIAALSETIQEGLASYPQERRAGVVILFSAHSLPLSFVAKGDPYPGEIQKTIDATVKRLSLEGRWHLSFQSKVGRIKWLEPSTETKLGELSRAGHKDVLVVPISFISDHIETLQEIDILYRDIAERLGMTGFRRCRALGCAPTFIHALADLVRSAQSSLVSSGVPRSPDVRSEIG